MLDVTALILADHATLRRGFAMLDDAHDDPAALAAVWKGLARMLDVHAACEEEVFYPHLLQVGDDDAEDETDDAVRDHNEIRDAVRAAEQHGVGTDEWRAAVKKARVENDDHLAEEEHDALPDFRRNAPDELRARLAVQWLEWRYAHDSGAGVDTGDKDPQQYIAEHS
ncbi:MAG: hemerythrin-like protein [Modestobacter sp.]|nr:hemerythrin-like protein [Modestobacter sp.]